MESTETIADGTADNRERSFGRNKTFQYLGITSMTFQLWGTQGQITDMAIHLKRLEVIKKRMNHILSENTGKPLDVVTADCERDNFMSAQEAMEYGLIDKVIDKR